MRLWSLHPSYLDSKGLVALWREGLLARKVLRGQTRGYRHHAQLRRFQAEPHPVEVIEAYLWGVYEESARRGYHFDRDKLGRNIGRKKLPVTIGQLRYELNHLARKLTRRDLAKYLEIVAADKPKAHPLFRIVPGGVAPWERESIA